MAKVQYNHSVKYHSAYKVAHTPFTVNDDDVEALRKEGAIVIGAMPKSPEIAPPADNGQEGTKTELTDEELLQLPLEEMTVAELTRFAALKEIDIKGISRKADILEEIQAQLEARSQQ
jgi:hypothetical protein